MFLLFDVPIVASVSAAMPTQMAAIPMVENIPVAPPVQRWRPRSVPNSAIAPAPLPNIPSQSFFRRQPMQSAWHYPLASTGQVTSRFGWRIHPILGDRRFHAGLDLAAPTGTPVLAAAPGQVQFAATKGSYGETVIVRHRDGRTQTLYAHLSKILVQSGQIVQPGQTIGLVGSTGRSTGPHLHFEVRQRQGDEWQAVNPEPMLGDALPQRPIAQQ